MAKKDQIETEIPKSTAARSAKMVSIPVGLAGRGVLGLGKQLVGQSSSVVITDIQEKTAEQLFKVLGELKGGAMKFGQALSVFEAALPENIAKPYRETLTKLQESALRFQPALYTRYWRKSSVKIGAITSHHLKIKQLLRHLSAKYIKAFGKMAARLR